MKEYYDKNLGVVSMAIKEDAVRTLAFAHYDLEPEITEIYTLKARPELENSLNEPIKLLEVNGTTVPSGVMPLAFGAIPERGIPYASVIVEVTPDEYQQIRRDQLKLPTGWSLGEMIPRPIASPHGSIQNTVSAGN
jgi:hypothetical protein